jgi:hypothetical protein
MLVQPHARREPSSLKTSLEYSTSLVTHHLQECLQTLGATALAEKVGRCCATFRVITCANGHVYQPIPAERGRHRLCLYCARWRQQRAMKRLGPAIQALRRLSVWKTTIRSAVAGYEVTYHWRGWHVHLHLLASRQAWWDHADLAATWQRVTGGHGTVVDIRDRDADVRASVCRTLTYPFKPMNLAAWGPAQVAECIALGRTKLAECYGALCGLATELAEDGEESDDSPHCQALRWVLATGTPCPSCGASLTAQWFTAEEVHQARQRAARRSLAPPHRPRAA